MDFEISTEEFQRFRTLIYDESGITLNDQKQGLVASRLSKRLRDLKLSTFSDYYEQVTRDSSREEFTRMLDLISTNKTDFFREPKHFDFLREEILPQLGDEKRIRIWSSACSTGEEPYTIAMTLYEGVSDPAQWDFKILASDLSTRVLAKAAAGVYDAERVDDVPPETGQATFPPWAWRERRHAQSQAAFVGDDSIPAPEFDGRTVSDQEPSRSDLLPECDDLF